MYDSYGYLVHSVKGKLSKYLGGFKIVNGRLNNTPAYNADYYEKNKDKWPEYPSQKGGKHDDSGKHEAPKENKGGKMGNGMPSNIPSGKDNEGNQSTLDILKQMKAERDAHDAEVAAKRDSKFVAEDEGGGKASKGKGGKSGGGKSSSAAEKAPKQEKAPKEEKKSSGSSGSKEDSKKEEDKKKQEELKKRDEEESKRKESDKKKTDMIDKDGTLSDDEKGLYKNISEMANRYGVSIQSLINDNGFDAIFSRFFTKQISDEEKQKIKERFMKFYEVDEAIKHGWVIRRKNDELYHGGLAMAGKLYNLYSNRYLKHSASGLIGGGVSRASRSRYSGGFVRKNNRMNNSKEYNHDYYIRNKEKWKQYTDEQDGKGQIDSSSSSGNTHRPFEWYDEKGEEYFYGDWSEDKLKYVSDSPSFQKLYKQAENARDAYKRTGLPSHEAAFKKYAVLATEETIRLGKEYDDKNKPRVSREYQEELEYNSRRNKYR